MNFDPIDDLAKQLHHDWETPELWTSIERAAQARRRRRAWLFAAPVLAAAAGLAIFLSPVLRRAPATLPANSPLLTEQAMAEASAAEAAYRKSIDRLAQLASDKLSNPATPLLRAYSQKLTVLDAAIAELNREIEHNGFNAHLHVQMSALYRDKQQTLEKVLHND